MNFRELRKSEVQLPRIRYRLSSRRGSHRERGKLERPWELYGRLLLLHQLLDGHAVCLGDLRHGRHVGISLARLQGDQGPVGYLGKLRRLLMRKTTLLPKNPQLHRDRSRHHCSSRSEGRSPVEPRSDEPTPARDHHTSGVYYDVLMYK